MKKNIAIVLLAAGMFFSAAGFVSAANVITLPNPLCPAGLNAQGQPNDAQHCIQNFPALIRAITGYISTIIGVIAVLMFVWAGALFVTAGANPGNVEKAKHALIWAVIGLAIALAGTGLVAVIGAVIGNTPPM